MTVHRLTGYNVFLIDIFSARSFWEKHMLQIGKSALRVEQKLAEIHCTRPRVQLQMLLLRRCWSWMRLWKELENWKFCDSRVSFCGLLFYFSFPHMCCHFVFTWFVSWRFHCLLSCRFPPAPWFAPPAITGERRVTKRGRCFFFLQMKSTTFQFGEWVGRIWMTGAVGFFLVHGFVTLPRQVFSLLSGQRSASER